ncbi:helix-turn-helix domain-containing protein [Chitinophaga barathri]|uniref:DNA-binding protein n=1 Tax=Chitinophaga barathri TaxID=1647451 RepID=A0A3N4MBQ4_9BACT|nr:helix-turn-helix domain-containing protein [Chitinophaga barathri]RPD41282.1 DNA-binding protein [Chitinophaga barathri]
MSEQMQFIGFSLEQARLFIEGIVTSCLQKNLPLPRDPAETPLTIREACKVLGISAPTLRKLVEMSIIRRHDLGPRKKVFYRSELEEDIKRLRSRGDLPIQNEPS